MRRVNGLRSNGGAEGVSEAAEQRDTNTAAGPRMQNAMEFYQRLGERRFGDLSQAVDGAQLANVLGIHRLREMTARLRDEDIRKVAANPSATVTPERIFRAWAGLLVDDLKRQPNAPADMDGAFGDALSWGEKTLLELRAEQPIVYRNTLQTTTDFISKVGTYEPEVLLAREIAKRAELGGTSVLTETLERCFVPSDLHRALGAQVATLPKVASAVPQAPAALVQLRLDDLGILDTLMTNDAAYAADVAKLRQSLGLKRSAPGFQLNLRDQVDGPLELRAAFGRLAAHFTTGIDHATRELVVILARLQSTPDISIGVKKVAFVQIDAHLRRLTKQAAAAGTHAPTFASLAQALVALRAAFEAEFIKAAGNKLDPTMPRMLRDSVDTLIGNSFRVTGDAHFAAEHMVAALDPGAIMLRRVLDAPVRDTLVNAALAQSTTPVARAGQIALIADKAKRDAELAKLIATDNDFRPTAENAALLLSWPDDVPRPTTEAAAKEDRAKQLATFGDNNLNDLIEQGLGETEIFTELLRLGGKGHFHVGADDNKLAPSLQKIISGQVKPEKGAWFGGADTLTTLLESPAIAALPAQMKAGANEDAVRKSLIRAIRLQNGQLIHEDKGLRALLRHPDAACRIELQTVLDVLEHTDTTPDPTMPGRTLSTVDPGANILFAYRVLVECSIGLGAVADDDLRAAGRRLLKRANIACLAPYASMSLEDNLKIVTRKAPDGIPPDSPHFLPMLDRLDLPETVLASIAERDDLDQFPAPVLYEVFARAVEDKSVTLETVAKLAIAATTLRAAGTQELYATNVWATFQDLATRNYEPKLGSMILAGMSGKTNIDVIYRAAASLAAEGKLFDANEVANAVMERDPATTRALVNELGAQAPKFFAALTLETRAKLLGRVMSELGSTTDASVLDLAGPCFARLTELTTAGHEPEGLAAAVESIVINAAIRVGKDPIETSALAEIFANAQSCGLDVEKVTKTIMTDAKARPAQVLTPAQLAAVRFEVARLVPTSDVGELKAAIPGGKLDAGPYMAAFDLIEHRALPDDVLQLLCRSAIGWAADQKAFARVVTFRKCLADAGHNDRVAVFDAALDSAMKDKPDVWSAVPEARTLAAVSKLDELRPQILELAAGGDEAAEIARALADRIAASGPYAAELVPLVLSALRREVRAMRPSLDDIHVGLEVPEDPQAIETATAPVYPTKDFHGLPIRLFQGDTSHGTVPDFLPFIDTPTGMNNMKRLSDAMDCDAPFIVCLGDPGPGKTYSAKVYAHHSGSPMVELDGGPERRADEAQGAWSRDDYGMPEYLRAAELEIFTKGGIIVDDEFQFSRRFILEQRGEQAGRFNKKIMVRTNETETVERHPETKILLIGNLVPEEIPPEIMENARVIYFDALPIEDQIKIAQSKAPTLNEADLQLIGKMQVEVEIKHKHENLGKSLALSVRNLTRAAKRAERFRSNPELATARAARESYIDGVIDPVVKESLSKSFKAVFGVTPEETLVDPASIEIKQGPRAVNIGEATVAHGPNKVVEPSKLKAYIGKFEVPYILGDRERVELEALAKAMQMGESKLYVNERESGVIGMIEAMAQLTGLDHRVKEVTRETTVAEMFGETATRAIDDRNFKTYFAPGIINQLNQANKGGIVVLRYVDRLKDATRIRLHRMLEERKIPGKDGKMVDMHPNLHIIMTTSPSEHRKLGLALQNRVTQRYLKAKTPDEVKERLMAMGEKLKVPALVVQDMVDYQTLWSKMITTRVAKYVPKHHLPKPGMKKLITWLTDFGKVMNGTSGLKGDRSAQIRHTLIEGGLTHYAVPDSRDFETDGTAKKPDLETLRDILTALADGNDEQVRTLSGNLQ